MKSRPEELEDFKSKINLSALAASYGFQIDRKACSRNSVGMKTPGGEKIIIARGLDRHWTYFNVHDNRDNGTVIDFVMNREGVNFGQVRKLLRPWIGESPLPMKKLETRQYVAASKLEPATRDILAVQARYAAMRMLGARNAYLEDSRQIVSHILTDPAIEGRIRLDDRNNIIFPHWNHDGICGYEMKNRTYTGFARGGQKGLWGTRPAEGDRKAVFCETGIDALSYASLHGMVATRLYSTAGELSPQQPAFIRAAITKLPPGGEIIIATDNDEAGEKLAERIEGIFRDLSPSECVLRIDRPETPGHDWNDALRASGAPCEAMARKASPLPALAANETPPVRMKKTSGPRR